MREMEFMVIEVDGSTRWIRTDRKHMCDVFRDTIGCDCLENVRTWIPDVCLIVDESGKIKNPPQQHNDVASCLYLGWIFGNDDICGPAILVAIHLVDGDPDWVPLSAFELEMVEDYLSSI